METHKRKIMWRIGDLVSAFDQLPPIWGWKRLGVHNSEEHRWGSFDQLPPIWGWKPVIVTSLSLICSIFRSTPPNLGMETFLLAWQLLPSWVALTFDQLPPNLGMETEMNSICWPQCLHSPFDQLPPIWGWKPRIAIFTLLIDSSFRSTPPNLGMETLG